MTTRRTPLADESSDLVVLAQRSLDHELPPDVQARRVLSAIGGDEVGHATFSSVLGRLDDRSAGAASVAITRSLKVLGAQKEVLRIDVPAGQASSSRRRRYRVADPYLRFWFRFVEPFAGHIARGRADVALTAFDAGWTSWRGRAIEPEVHAALERLAPSLPVLASSGHVGAWWNRDNHVEVDVVARDRRQVVALGTVKWRERKAVTAGEAAELARARESVPGAGGAALVAICPAGVRGDVEVDLVLDAEDLLAAWAP